MNQKMETVMQSHICLFIGLSGDDERLDNPMMETKESGKHAYNPTSIGYWGVAFTTSEDPVETRKWAIRGVYLQKLLDYSTDLPEFLFEICQKAALK
jgi:hypothetical protein